MGLKGMKQGNLLAEPFLTLWFYCSDGGLTLETLAFRIPVWWSIYILNSVDKTKVFVAAKVAPLPFLSLRPSSVLLASCLYLREMYI